MLRQQLNFAGLAIGALASFTAFGVMQEKIFRGRYGQELQADGKIGETYMLPITFESLQFIANAIAAKVLITIFDHPKNDVDQEFYAASAVYSVLGKVATHWSLVWVNFNTQVIGKSPKPIPVMIFGYLFGGKTYSLKKIVLVILVVSGIILFMYKDDQQKKDGENLLLGNSMMIFSLLMEGCQSATEDRMRAKKKPSTLNLMLYLNVWSVLVGFVGIVTFNEAPRFVKFVTKHPEILQFIALAMLVTILGQFFRNALVANFGPLPMAIISTVRKFISVFMSNLIFGNSLSIRQWCAAGIIFGALFLDIFLNKKKKKKTETDSPDKPQKTVVDDNRKIEVYVIQSSDQNNN